MERDRGAGFTVRRAHPEEHAELGRILVDAYASLPGMPGAADQPDYYAMLRDVERRSRIPAITVFAAVKDSGELLGSVDFIDDMRSYGSGGTAGSVANAAGVRLLAVKPQGRGGGVGKALTRHCIERARALGRARVILHTTRAMQLAWAMYERLGFARFPEIDFRQGALDVFGFQLDLRDSSGSAPR